MTYRALATTTLALTMTAFLAGVWTAQSLRRAAAAEGDCRDARAAAVTRYLEATGNTAAMNCADLVARVPGFVQAISYNDGQFVKKGTSLFTIEPEPYKLKLDAAKAAVAARRRR